MLVVIATLLSLISNYCIVFPLSSVYILSMLHFIAFRDTTLKDGCRAMEYCLNPMCSTIDKGYSWKIILVANSLLRAS